MAKLTEYKAKNSNPFNLLGVGFGAFNLGLAALINEIKGIKCLFVDKKPSFSWHEDMILHNSKLQVHYLKDLVTLVDPTNKLSFLAYLVETGRIFQFMHRKQQTVSRAEFNEYFQWAASKIKNVCYNSCVQSIHFENKKFIVQTETYTYSTNNIIIGTGLVPNIPNNFKKSICNSIFHNSTYKTAKAKLNFSEKKIAIIGGGQSGAEVIDDIISSSELPAEIVWISDRPNFQPLENSCFSNELYSPWHIKYFYKLPYDARLKKLNDLILCSDGISEDLSDSLYNKIYELRHVKKMPIIFSLLPHHLVTAITQNDPHCLHITNLDNQKVLTKHFDITILATGYKYEVPYFMNNLFPGITSIEDLEINPDYSINWNNSKNKIFIQNGLKHQFGISDPNLSLAAWRNAVIINSILKKNIYNVDLDNLMFNNNYVS
ncbi:MAG: SidA/IucD/PvdA family monooxygenase [Burkholderiales bacterium]|nr:SidA/IucD/PvdA family monooxygenase [Burkholderiales bacterium]